MQRVLRGCEQEAQYTIMSWLLHLGLEGLGVVGGETISRSSMLKDNNVVVITQVIILVKMHPTIIRNRCILLYKVYCSKVDLKEKTTVGKNEQSVSTYIVLRVSYTRLRFCPFLILVLPVYVLYILM